MNYQMIPLKRACDAITTWQHIAGLWAKIQEGIYIFNRVEEYIHSLDIESRFTVTAASALIDRFIVYRTGKKPSLHDFLSKKIEEVGAG